jgi:GT2 family glycosyltransferase
MPLKQGIANATVLVVDDASPDDPKSYLDGLADHCIYKSSNGGYAATVNIGLKYFLDNEEYDLVMVTNSDIKVDVTKAQSIADAILKNMEDREVGVLGFLEGSDSNAEFYESINISGFLFILTRAVVEKVGLLDEGFYMYGEEQDYFLRVRDANYKLVQSRVVVEHEAEGSGTSGLKNSWFAIRNSLLLELSEK